MGVRFPSVFTNTFIGPLPANANETVVFTTPPLTLPLDGATVFLHWHFSYTPSTGHLAGVFRLRRGTTTAGQLVGVNVWQIPVSAGNNNQASGAYFDNPGAVAGQQYSLTIGQVGATAAGVFLDGCLLAFAL